MLGVGSGAWLTQEPLVGEALDDLRNGAVWVTIDASACQGYGLHQAAICVSDILGNVVGMWSLQVTVFGTFVLQKAPQAQIPMAKFALDEGALPKETSQWVCLVSRFTGVKDGARSEFPNVASVTPDYVVVTIKDSVMLQARHCQMRIVERNTGKCLRLLRLLQADSGLMRVATASLAVGTEHGLEEVADGLGGDVDVESEAETDHDDEDEDEEQSLVADLSGQVYMSLEIAMQGKRKTRKIQVNVSRVLRLMMMPEDWRDKAVWAGFRESNVWNEVQRQMVEVTGQAAFVYEWRAGTPLSVVNERDFLLLVRVWLELLRTEGRESLRIRPLPRDAGDEFEIIETQRSARFTSDDEEVWLTRAVLPGSVSAFLSAKNGTLAPFESSLSSGMQGNTARLSVVTPAGVLQRSYDGLAIKFAPSRGGVLEVRGGDKEIVISRCQVTSPNRRTILGRRVRVVILDSAQYEESGGKLVEQPVCEVPVGVLPDGTAAMQWVEFQCAVVNLSGNAVDARLFTYAPAAATRGTFSPWCLKTVPHTHIAQVEDELTQGISAYSLKLRMTRLERMAKHITLQKDMTGDPVLIELTIIHEDIGVFMEEKRRAAMCLLLEKVIAKCVKVRVKPQTESKVASEKKVDQKKKEKGHAADVLKPGVCELVDALEVSLFYVHLRPCFGIVCASARFGQHVDTRNICR